ncbi:hypothetical protein [Bartonella quintana]|nr:hypothetical protein [Bartonella quintana]
MFGYIDELGKMVIQILTAAAEAGIKFGQKPHPKTEMILLTV